MLVATAIKSKLEQNECGSITKMGSARARCDTQLDGRAAAASGLIVVGRRLESDRLSL